MVSTLTFMFSNKKWNAVFSTICNVHVVGIVGKVIVVWGSFDFSLENTAFILILHITCFFVKNIQTLISFLKY